MTCFEEDVKHLAKFSTVLNALLQALKDQKEEIDKLKTEKKECKCSCEDECLCCEDKEPTIEDLYEMAKFLVDTTPDLMEIKIETIYKNDKDEEEDDK